MSDMPLYVVKAELWYFVSLSWIRSNGQIRLEMGLAQDASWLSTFIPACNSWSFGHWQISGG
jgi:hypothetical protein